MYIHALYRIEQYTDHSLQCMSVHCTYCNNIYVTKFLIDSVVAIFQTQTKITIFSTSFFPTITMDTKSVLNYK